MTISPHTAPGTKVVWDTDRKTVILPQLVRGRTYTVQKIIETEYRDINSSETYGVQIEECAKEHDELYFHDKLKVYLMLNYNLSDFSYPALPESLTSL